jgi:uncharacterized membrane protein YheB (UPF0754 family)
MQENLNFFLIPIIGAAIGWVTNYIAVKMLFHPRKPISFLFFSVQGVFPKRQSKLAIKLGEVVSKELISTEEIKKYINEVASSTEIINIVENKLENFIAKKLPVLFPLLAMVLNAELIQTIKKHIIDEFKPLIDDLVAKLSNQLDSKLNIHQIVEDKVTNFSSDKLEEILFSIMRREFKFIELVGAVLGFLIGIIQLLLINQSIL